MHADEGSSLASLLALVEKHGSVVVPARALDKLASIDARQALHAAGIIAAAPAAVSWPCDVRGCSREIRANYGGARKPLVAVCSQVPSACRPVELAFEDVAEQRVSIEALVAEVCALLGAEADRAALARLHEPRSIGDARPPVLVAVSRAPARDVFWAASPRDMDLAAFCARRERVTRATLVLVPTGERVPLDLAARYARGEQVEISALADRLEVRAGKVALIDGQAAIPDDLSASRPPLPSPGHGMAAALGVTRWEQIRLIVIDAHAIRIEAKGKALLRTFVEFGFVDGRKKDSATPTTAWRLLLLICKLGRLQPSEYAQLEKKPYGVKKALEVLRVGMCAAFGLEEDPIRRYARGLWSPRFLVANASDAATRR